MSFRYLIGLCLSLVLVAGFAGCQKKKADQALADLTKIDTTAAAKDTGDVFNEYYDENADTPVEQTKAPVKKVKPRNETYSSNSSTSFVEGGSYVVQIACVLSANLARRRADECTAKGWPAYTAEVETPTPDLPGTYHRVRIGGFNDMASAKRFCENELAPAGFEYWIDNRSNDNIGMGGSGLGQGGGYEYQPAAKTTGAYSAPALPKISEPSTVGRTKSSDMFDDEYPSSPAPAVAPSAGYQPRVPAPATETLPPEDKASSYQSTPYVPPKTEVQPTQQPVTIPQDTQKKPAQTPAADDWDSDEW
jgi:hypothetical protein